MVYADEHRIEQVLVNLVNNAVKYAPGSYRIFLNFQTDGEMVKINIRDTGPGIPSEKIPHLFDRYYRADNSGKAGFWAWFGSLYQRGDRQAAWRANWG
jgi:signal transduction histidine kinase